MATKVAIPHSLMSGGMHTAGIFSDMTVDGPEIGTLVLVIDRAKNLPNRKTMGKQNPYCAARLGKEAKKTETDKRGGQTPKWDQELRFTVHESPDYENLKVSVFSEDKRTDLIGEAWLGLTDIVVPGGGKNDIWQTLHYKGKYAGEIRIELTYYDSRPKPDKSEEQQNVLHSNGSSRTKRRPLPSDINNATFNDMNGSPAMSLRAKHGPREFRAPASALSIPSETTLQEPPRVTLQDQAKASQSQPHGSALRHHPDTLPLGEGLPDERHNVQQHCEDLYRQPDFLPKLPPSNSKRGPHPRHSVRIEQPYQLQSRPLSQLGLSYSHSAPIIPIAYSEEPGQYDEVRYNLNTDYPELIPDLESQYRTVQTRRRHSATPVWDDQYSTDYSPCPIDADAAPPPPPLHSHSSPVIPQQHNSPSDYYLASPSAHYHRPVFEDRRHHESSPSQAQAFEHEYQDPFVMAGGRSLSHEGVSQYPGSIDQGLMPQVLMPSHHNSGNANNPTSRPYQHANRPSISEAFYSTPSRAHPLSQVLPRSSSPQPYAELSGFSPQPYGNKHNMDSYAPSSNPRAISTRPAPPTSASMRQPERRSMNSYSIQFPVRAFESSDQSPLSTAQRAPQPHHQPTVARKSVSPRPSLNTASSVPYGPDSFDVHNPHVRPSTLPSSSSPQSPYEISQDTIQHDDARGPIVGWHGQEIDPSDHLPVNSWAPEPDKKNSSKTYGLGRERDLGPRLTQSIGAVNGRIGKDTVVNVRMGSVHDETEHTAPDRSRPSKRAPGRSLVEMPRQQHSISSVPNPYALPESFYGRDRDYGGKADGYLPSLPPKIPLGYNQFGNESQSLQQELASIDIGSSGPRHSRAGSTPGPAAYVPVRSHRDRMSYY